MHSDTVASFTTERETSLAGTKHYNRKSTMNSLSRKYPLVIISPNKDLLYSSSSGESNGKSICEHQIESTKSVHKQMQKKAPDILSLTEEANAKWEILKKNKLKSSSSSLSAQHLKIPLVDVKSQQQQKQKQQQHQDKKQVDSQLNSPNRAKLRMAPSIDLPLRVAIGNQECEITNFPKKAKLNLTSRASSRSNKGKIQKYSTHQHPRNNRNILNSEFINSSLISYDRSITNRRFPISKSDLVSCLISRTEKFEKSFLQKRSSLSDSGISEENNHLTYVSCNHNSKLRFSPKVKSPTKVDNSDSTQRISLPSSDVGTDGLYTDTASTEDIDSQSVLTTSEPLIYEYPSSDSFSQNSTDEETHTQIETGMVGVYMEASYSQLPPLCSLCCSAGLHELVFCAVCCDCYHRFCVGLDSDSSGEMDWVCSSCISCAVCGRGRDVEMVHQCYKCRSFYHVGCLGIHLPFPPGEEGLNNWPCPRCVICQGCGTQRPEKFPEQLSTAKLFCKRCVLLRKKGNFCPVCDKVYEANDWNCKMIECDSCNTWLHDTCESISNEEYYLLGELPGDIPYTCSICQRMQSHTIKVPWRHAIEESRNKRIQSVVDQLNSNQMLKTLLTNLQNAPNGLKSLNSTLSQIISNVETVPYSTIADFCKEVMSVLQQIFKSVDKQSILHRYTFSLQTSFIKLICEEFPWFVMPPIDSVPRPPKQERKRRISTRNCNYFPSSDFFNPTETPVLFPAHKFDHKYTASELNTDINSSDKNGERAPVFSSPSKHKPTDRRQCILCKHIGDTTGKEDRLLPCGINEWVHINCAIWSSDVYTSGSCIKNIDSALLTGLKSCCSLCSLMGATVGCYNRHCLHLVHYKCALTEGWVFLKNRKVFCPGHGCSFDSKVVCSERDFLIDEFLYVESNSASQDQRLHNMTKLTGPRKLNIVSGCVRVYSLGSVVPSSDTRDAIYPQNFRSSRLFWSARKPSLLSTYTCFVKEYIPEEQISHPDINYSIQHNADLISTKNHVQHAISPPGYQAELTREYPQIDTQPIKLVQLTDYSPPILFPTRTNRIFEVDTFISNKPESPLSTGLNIELNMDSDISSEFPSFKGLFEQSFPFLKQTDSSLSQFQKTINYSKISGNKLFPLLNEDFYLTQHLTRLNDSELGYGDKQQQQQQQYVPPTQGSSKLKFIIVCSDGFATQSDTLQGAWDNVIHELTLAREASHMPPLSFQSTSPQDMFGFTLHCVQREIEQLDDIDKCSLYKFRFCAPPKREEWNDLDILYENPFGAARCISYTTRSKFGMFNFFYSKQRPPPPKLNLERLSSLLSEEDNYPELQFHNPQFFENGTLPFFRYRQMIKNLPSTVRVFRSKIQGLGLFSLRDIDPGDMIIEYTGLVIRPFMCDIKEALYESRGIGCYMFKIDQNQVVDGTMSGNASRFINHSCHPNCASKIVIIELKKKILIFAQRRILMGEELTYDYKFPLEEIKIPCLCNSKKCRKYMN